MAKSKRMSSEERKAIKRPDGLEQAVAGVIKTTKDNSAMLIKVGIFVVVAFVLATAFYSFRASKDSGVQDRLAEIDKIYIKEQTSYEDKARVQQEKFREVLSGMSGKASAEMGDFQKKLDDLRKQAEAIQPDYTKSAAEYEKLAAQHLQVGSTNPTEAEKWLSNALTIFSKNPVMGPQIRQALMGLYEDEGKMDLAMKMADQNMRSPARHIKDFASLTKARLLASTDAEKAKSILDSLVSDEDALYKDQARALQSTL